MELELPSHLRSRDESEDSKESSETTESTESAATVRPSESAQKPNDFSPLASTLQPAIFSILVVCPLQHSREATVKHIEMTLPKTTPHHITARESLTECRAMLGGDDPVKFTHIVLSLHDTSDVIEFMRLILLTPAHSPTAIVIISDLGQKREIMNKATEFNFEQLMKDRRLRFVFKPVKPSKFAVIFDPRKEREMSTDRNQDSAQQVAMDQKLMFDIIKTKLGSRGHRVLLVEDNKVNQAVMLKFIKKIAIDYETAEDGRECTEKVFALPPGHFSIILCDLHMPHKDGYQTCKDIRRWERKNKYRPLPIIALSANVLGDVYTKCVEAGFNSYVTKPVDFKELADVLLKFLDPADPTKPHELMQKRPSST